MTTRRWMRSAAGWWGCSPTADGCATCVPGSHGGATEDLDVRSLCLIREILARRSGLADFCFVMQGLGTGAISLFGTDALKSRYLPGSPPARGSRHSR